MFFQRGGSNIILAPGSGGNVVLQSRGVASGTAVANNVVFGAPTWTRSTGSALFVDLSATGSSFLFPNGNPSTFLTGGVSGFAVVKDSGGINFATISSGAMVGQTTYTDLATPTSSDTGSAVNYRLIGSTTLAIAPTYNSLKIVAITDSQQYDLAGNTVTLTTGGVLVTGDKAYTITGSAGGQLGANGSELIVHNYSTSQLTIAVPVGGLASEVVFAGTGTTALTVSNSARTGPMTIDGGTVVISDLNQLGSGTAGLNFGGGVTVNTSTLAVSGGATLRWGSSFNGNIANDGVSNRPITFFSSGTLDVGSNNVTLSVTTGSLFASGNISTDATTTNAFSITAGTGAGSNNPVNGTIIKEGTGNLILNSPSGTFYGTVVVQKGTLTANYPLISATDGTSLGGKPPGSGVVSLSVLVNPGATLALAQSNVMTFNALNMNLRNIYITEGTLTTAASTFNRLGNIWLQGGTLDLGSAAGGGLGSIYLGTVPTAVTGTGVNGPNATISALGNATAANTKFSVITGGVVNLGPNTAFDVDITATRDLANFNGDLIVNSLLTNQTISQGTGADGVGTAGAGNAAYGSFSKFGAGTMVLKGANTYSGGTNVYAGTLVIAAPTLTDSATGTGPVVVNPTGTLSGTGLISGQVTVYGAAANAANTIPIGAGGQTIVLTTTAALPGILSPGNGAPGGLSLANGLSMQANSMLKIGIYGTTVASLGVPGDSTVGGATPTSNNYLTITGGTTTINSLTRFSVDLSLATVTFANEFVPHSYRIATSVGDQSLLNITNQSQFEGAAVDFSVTGNAGGDIFLNFTPVPEPTTAFALSAIPLLAAYARRRYRRRFKVDTISPAL